VFPPDRHANLLCGLLIVPTARASQVPFRMIANKFIQDCPSFQSVTNAKTIANYSDKINY